MKPFPFQNLNVEQQIFNYRLSRGRRTIEKTLSICTGRFRILRKPIDVEPPKAIKIVLAICALHNFLMVKNGFQSGDVDHMLDGVHVPEELCDSAMIPSLPINSTNASRPSETATNIRCRYANYFSTPHGAVPWQNQRIEELE